MRPTQKTGEWPLLGLGGGGGGHAIRPGLPCATNTKKLASGYALDRIMPRCKLFIGFILICATNTENWRVAMCEASLAIYSSFGLRPLGALCYELCDQHRKLACPRYILDLDGYGLIRLCCYVGDQHRKLAESLRSISQCVPAYRKDVRRFGHIVICFSFGRPIIILAIKRESRPFVTVRTYDIG